MKRLYFANRFHLQHSLVPVWLYDAQKEKNVSTNNQLWHWNRFVRETEKVWALNHLCHSHLCVLSIAGIIVKFGACYLAIKIWILHYCSIINSHYWKVNEGRFIMSVINTDCSFRGKVTTTFHQSTRWYLSEIKNAKIDGFVWLTVA